MPPAKDSVETTVHRPDMVFSKITGSQWDIKKGDIKLIKKIGEGATGVIYEAKFLGQSVAAKSLKTWGDGLIEQAYKDIVMELDVLECVGKHPNLVGFFGVCMEDKRRPVVIEELVGGPCLEDYLQNGGCRGDLKRGTILAWSQDLFRALEFLHNRDPIIMHRDLKPGNLILTGDRSTLKLADFGMSKMVRKSEMAHVINTGYTGTVRYMAPEVLTQRKGHYTEKADIYSAGLIIWYIASGVRPLVLKTDTEEDLRVRPPLESMRWPNLGAIADKCWAHDPAHRPSATAVLRDLAAMPDAPTLRVPAPPQCFCLIS
mmetsp:Transcript_33605/g.65571  ORF Transcript_33605/g.65571 Transcript_33605/m.65571 type:complete len:316 (+) Transcript_33605:247-1194(+)